MATAAQVTKAALQKILVHGAESSFEPSEFQDAIFAMNTYMLDLDANGVTLGYTEVTDLGDEITIPSGALRGLIYNLAIESASEYGGIVSQEVREIASKGEATMRVLGVSNDDRSYPNTLPIGSGNHDGIFTSTHFFPETEAQILAETTGSISLETNTNETAEA